MTILASASSLQADSLPVLTAVSNPLRVALSTIDSHMTTDGQVTNLAMVAQHTAYLAKAWKQELSPQTSSSAYNVIVTGLMMNGDTSTLRLVQQQLDKTMPIKAADKLRNFAASLPLAKYFFKKPVSVQARFMAKTALEMAQAIKDHKQEIVMRPEGKETLATLKKGVDEVASPIGTIVYSLVQKTGFYTRGLKN